MAVVGVGHRAAVCVQLLIQAGAGVVVQLFAVGLGEGNGQVHAVAVLGVDFGPGAEAEQRRVVALSRCAVVRQAGADQLTGGIPAVFLAVACVLAALVKGEGCLADVVAIQVLIAQRVQQVGGVNVLVDGHRHSVQRQGHLQKQVAPRPDRADFADAVHIGKNSGQSCGAALGHALDQHVRGGNAPLRLCAVQRAQRHGHRALAGVVAVVQAGQRVGAGSRGGFRRGFGGGGGRLFRRGRHSRLAAAAHQQCGQQSRRAAQCLQFSHTKPLSQKQRGPPPGEPRCRVRPV